jgi:hypothetical protein
MLKEIEPRLARAALVGNPKTTDFDYFLRASKAATLSFPLSEHRSPPPDVRFRG